MRKITLLLICISMLAVFVFSSCDKLIPKFPSTSNTVTQSSNGVGNEEDKEPERVEYTVTFDSAGGTEVPSMTVLEGEKGRVPTKPTKPGYTFEGWYFGEERWSFSQNPITQNMHVVAKWTPSENTVVFDGNGADEGSVEEIKGTTGSVITLPDNAFAKEGYTFGGWSADLNGDTVYEEGDEYTVSTDSVNTIYAVWVAIPYEITYELNGGNNNEDNPEALYADKLPLTLLKPNKSECIFVGWYTNAEFEGEAVTELTELGEIQLYAKFMDASSGFIYKEHDDYAEIKGYSGTDTEVLIPEYYNGLPITVIGERAFIRCENVKSVTLTEYVLTIGRNAFKDCTALETIENYQTIGRLAYGAFHGCIALKSFTIPQRIEEISASLFEDCAALESVEILGNLKAVGEYAFKNCKALKEIAISDGAKSIGDSAFAGCVALTEITLGSGLEAIGSSAFEGCEMLGSINIPDNVMEMGASAFRGCKSLSTAVIGNGITVVNFSAFENCSSLKSLTLGVNITAISDYAFHNCDALESLVIGNKITSIGIYSFRGCDALLSVEIGDDVTLISDYAFRDCIKLQSIKLGNSVSTIGYYAFGGCRALAEIQIPESVVSIGSMAFSYCTSLESIFIPKNVSSLGEKLFYSSSALKEISVDENNETYSSVDGNLYTKSGFELLAYAVGKQDTSFEVPSLVSSISDAAFYGCAYLESVVIGEKVAIIGKQAFDGCTALTSVELEVASGWRCSGSFNATSGTNMSEEELGDNAKAAQYLRGDFRNYYWKRS